MSSVENLSVVKVNLYLSDGTVVPKELKESILLELERNGMSMDKISSHFHRICHFIYKKFDCEDKMCFASAKTVTEFAKGVGSFFTETELETLNE